MAALTEHSNEVMARFWDKVTRGEPGECWEWQEKSRHEFGYGVFRPTKHSGSVKAHRFAWAAVNGEIVDGVVIRHKCDNPPCCNPAHLEPGTQLDNMQDAVKRDRHKRGERGANKLTDAEVIAIRLEVSAGKSHESVASNYGISQPMVSAIANGKRWAHIGGLRTSSINKTHCVNGHLLEGSNLIPRKGAKGRCRICTRASQRKYKQKIRKAA